MYQHAKRRATGRIYQEKQNRSLSFSERREGELPPLPHKKPFPTKEIARSLGPTPSPKSPAVLVFDPRYKTAVASVAKRFGLCAEHAEGAVKLAKSLRVDDPGMFISFRASQDIHTNLARPGDGRPCDSGANDDESLQNLKNWVTDLVPQEKRQFIFQSGKLGIRIGNLTQDEFTDLQLSLSFSFTLRRPFPAWVMAMMQGDHSLGGLIAAYGSGVDQTTMSKPPSNIFFD